MLRGPGRSVRAGVNQEAEVLAGFRVQRVAKEPVSRVRLAVGLRVVHDLRDDFLSGKVPLGPLRSSESSRRTRRFEASQRSVTCGVRHRGHGIPKRCLDIDRSGHSIPIE